MPAPRLALGPITDLSRCCEPLAAEVPAESETAPLAAAFRALGDPVRLRLMGLLLTADGGEVCACDLVDPLGRAQPTVSHHLKVLREAGLVTSARRGTNIWYSARLDQIAALRAVLGANQPTGASSSGPDVGAGPMATARVVGPIS